jgi:5-amino-6-(5-phospho-D-ribitylamino)uracil phosphatase
VKGDEPLYLIAFTNPGMQKSAIMIKALFLDLDGTIVDAAGVISPGVKRILNEVQQAGVAVGLATGRPYFGSRSEVEELNIQSPSLFFSGGLIIEPRDDHVVFEAGLDKEPLLRLAEEAAQENMYCEFYTRDGYFTNKENPKSAIHFRYLRVLPKIASLKEVAQQRKILKAVFMSESPEEEARMRGFAARFPEFPCAFSTGAAHPQVLFGNVTSPQASRERCFEIILNHLKISAAEVAAFGDAEADLPFLTRAGFGYAMANAPENVRWAAPFTTKSVDQDGVAYALEMLRGEWVG